MSRAVVANRPDRRSSSGPSPNDAGAPQGAISRLRHLEREYDEAVRIAEESEAQRARLEQELARARRLAATSLVVSPRPESTPLATLPASGLRVDGRAIVFTPPGEANGGTVSIPLAELRAVRLGQRSTAGATFAGTLTFLVALAILLGAPLYFPRPAVLAAAFTLFFLLVPASAALIMSRLHRFLLVDRGAARPTRLPLADADVIAEGSASSNADRFIAAIRAAIAVTDE